MSDSSQEVLDSARFIFDTDFRPLKPVALGEPEQTDLYGSYRWAHGYDYTVGESVAALAFVGLMDLGDGKLTAKNNLLLFWGGTEEGRFFDAPAAAQIDLDTGFIDLWIENGQKTNQVDKMALNRVIKGLAALCDATMEV